MSKFQIATKETVLSTAAKILIPQIANKEGTNGVLRIIEPRKLTNNIMQSAARLYWITNNSGTPENRGGHKHPYKSEILTVMCGEAKFTLKEDGNKIGRASCRERV